MTHLGLQQRPAVAPLAAVGALHDDPLSRIERSSHVPLGGSLARPGGIRDKPGTLQTGQGRLHEGGGCPVNRGPEKVRSHPPPSSRARGWRLAAPHLLTGPSSATCRAALVRPVKAGRRVICRSQRTCGLGQSNGVVSWAHACEPREGSSWTTPSTRKGVAGPRFSKGQREAGRARQANQVAPTRNSRGFDAQTRFEAGWLWGIKKQALPLPAHTCCVSFRFVWHGLVLIRVGDQICGKDKLTARQPGCRATNFDFTHCGGIECYCPHPGCRVIA